MFSAQPPLLFASLAVGLRVVADSILGTRAIEIAFGAVALLSAAWLANELAGPLAAGATAIVLALSPGFLVYSRAVEAEGPMMALMTLALAVGARHARSPRAVLPVLTGFALAAAVLVKLFALEALLPALWLVCGVPGPWRRRARDGALMVVSVAVSVAANLLLVAPAAQWRQVVRMHEAAARLTFAGLKPAWRVVWDFLTLDAGLTAAAAAGFAALVLLRRRKEAGFFALWLGGMTVMLLAFHPLFPHHPAILLTALSACAGTGTGAIIAAPRRGTGALSLLGAGLLLYAAFIPRLAHADRHLLYAAGPASDAPLTSYVASHSRSSDVVAVDDLRVADDAHRLVVPPLCDPSNVRLRAGYMTTADVVGATRRYRPRIVLFSFGIFQQIPGYEAWLKRHYTLHPLPAGALAFTSRAGTAP